MHTRDKDRQTERDSKWKRWRGVEQDYYILVLKCKSNAWGKCILNHAVDTIIDQNFLPSRGVQFQYLLNYRFLFITGGSKKL